MNLNLKNISFGSCNKLLIKNQTFRRRALWTKMRFPYEISPLDYTGYHVNYILQDGWNGYGKLNLVVLIIMPILQYGWNGYGILNLFTLVIMPTLMKSFHWKNGMVKMDKMEYGPLN